MSKNNIEHKDKLGRALTEGACVAVSSGNSLTIAIIKKLNPKMITLVPVGKHFRGYKKYPDDMILLNGPDVSMFLLKNSG